LRSYIWGAVPLVGILVMMAVLMRPQSEKYTLLRKDGNLMVGEIAPGELRSKVDRGEQIVLLDVREPEEVAIVRLPGSVHIPMGEVPGRLHELDPDKETIVYCHHGVRSLHVANFLAQRDFEHVMSLAGGIDAWAVEIEPGMRRY
jgi:rhodanese-related sulfurtransferase